MERTERRAKIEQALVQAGGTLNMSATARELGVSRWTVRRDVEAVQSRWFRLSVHKSVEMLAERTATAAALAAIAEEALGQCTRLAGDPGQHGAAIGYLRTAIQALDKRAVLLALKKRPQVRVW